jgi:Ca-activated chloride channel family protein
MLRVRILLIVLSTAVVSAAGPSQEPGIFRVTGDMVPVFVTATDRSGRIVTTLTRDDFTLRDNGRPQPIALFDNSPQPVRLIVLVDVSSSMAGNLPLLRAAGAELFARLRTDDAAKVGTFGQQIAIMPSFTSDRQALVDGLPERIEPNAPTPLWRSIDQAFDAFGDAPGRRVILVASDGKDTPVGRFRERYISQPEIVERALRENVMLYALAMQSRFSAADRSAFGGSLMQQMTQAFPDPGFGKAADATGGGYVELRPREDLGRVLAGVVDELHSQYLLWFRAPATDGRTHDIEVRVAARDVKVRARSSYVAPRPR